MCALRGGSILCSAKMSRTLSISLNSGNYSRVNNSVINRGEDENPLTYVQFPLEAAVSLSSELNIRTCPLFVNATRWPSNPATWINCVGCCPAFAPFAKSGRTGIEGRRFGSKSNSQGTQGIAPSRGAEAPLLPSLFISLWRDVSTCSEDGHHTRMSPERVSTQENIQPHSI